MQKSYYLYLITIVTALGGLLFGYDTGVINGTQKYFSDYFELSPFMKGWIVSSALLGCFIGAIIAGPISRYLGRKNSLIISAILFSISAWGSGLPEFMPQSTILLAVFRVIGGFGIGIASMNAPMYIAEIAPAKIRGRLVTYYQLAIVLGFFLVFLTNYIVGNSRTELENVQYGWRVMFWWELLPSLLFLLTLLFVPKSPRWLSLKGDQSQAMKVLKRIHGQELALIEAKEINQSIEKAKSTGKISLLSKGILLIVFIGVSLSVLQQFTGINAVLYYGADIFEKGLGIGQSEVLKQQILLATVNLGFTLVAMRTVDSLGRKPLIYLGSFGMISGFLMLAITLKTSSVGIISLIGILLFIASFALSMGPIVWVLLSEIFPNSVRDKALSVAVAAQWAANFLVSFGFPVLAESNINNNTYWNGSLPYFLFSGFIAIIIVFTWKFIPETKGKSLEELEGIWK